MTGNKKTMMTNNDTKVGNVRGTKYCMERNIVVRSCKNYHGNAKMSTM